jgi:hypothetical protein
MPQASPETTASQPDSRPSRRQRKRHLRSDEVDELVAAYQAGATTYELATRHRVHRQTVTAILERRGVPIRYRSPSPDEVATAKALYADGQSLVAVGDQLGFDAGTIWRALKRAGSSCEIPRAGGGDRYRAKGLQCRRPKAAIMRMVVAPMTLAKAFRVSASPPKAANKTDTTTIAITTRKA